MPGTVEAAVRRRDDQAGGKLLHQTLDVCVLVCSFEHNSVGD